MNKIVIADKSSIIQHSLSIKLISAGYTIRIADSWGDLNNIFDNEEVDLIIMDVGFPNWKTEDAIRDLKRNHPELLIVITFKALTIPEIIDLVRNGADDCMMKPLDISHFMGRIRMLFDNRDINKHVKGISPAKKGGERYRQEEKVIVPTDKIQHMINLAKDRDVSVLLQGEEGVLKNAYARYLHQLGKRRPYSFVTVECSGAEGLESRLYGHVTQSDADHLSLIPGALSIAGQGTLLLKDIEYIPMPMQSGLVEVLSERRFTPIGGRNSIPLFARIVAATKQNIVQLVEEGRFSQELFYLVSVVHIEIPPLRQRRNQIPELMAITLGNLCRKMNMPLPKVEQECLKNIEEYTWPGNEREFIYRMERALILSEGGTFSVTLPIKQEAVSDKKGTMIILPEDNFSLKEYMQKKEEELLNMVLEKFDGRRNKAAAYLGISERTLRNKLNEIPDG